MDKQILEKHLSCVVKYLVGQVGHGISTGLCNVIVAKKACPVISRLDVLRICTDNPKSTTLSDVKCYSLSLCIFTYQ